MHVSHTVSQTVSLALQMRVMNLGKFAAVRRAIHKKSGVHFAAKFLKRRRRAQSSDKEIKHEIAVLILCSDSENIVQLNAVHESRADTALLLELATGGELQALLDNEGSLTEAQARICMREVLKALQFLHKRSIAHLDLKPQNILLTGENVEDGLKLCDFGISRVIENGSKVREILGTPDYVAPEVLQYEPLSLQTDIWSVGVLTYVLLSGYSPFGGDTKQETFLNISQCALTFPDDLFKGVSDQAIDFMKSTLRIKPNDRLTAAECLEHFWLKDEFTIDKRFCNGSMASDGISSDPYEIIDDEDDEDEDRGIEENDSDDQISNIIINKKQSTNNKTNGCLQKPSNSFNNSIELASQNHHQNATAAANSNGRITSSLTTRKSSNNINNTTCSNNSTINIQNNQKSSTVSTTTSTNYDEKTKMIDENNSENKENYLMNSSQLVLHLNGNNNSKSTTITANSGTSTVTNNRLNNSNVSRDNNCSLQLNGLNNCNNSFQTETNGYDHYHHNQHQHHQIEKLKSPQLVSSSSNSSMTFSPNNSTTVSTNTSTTNGHLNQNGTILFPDAPTTPKVIRKAPSDSPTSVKALVKKFQLESGEPLQTPTLLKETVLGTEYNECSLTNGTSSSSTTATTTTTTANDLKYLNGCNGSNSCNNIGNNSNDILNNEQHCNSSTKLLNGSNTNNSNSINSSPVKSFKATVASVAAAASCSVFCLHKCNGCGNSSGCRHSGNTTTQVVNNCSSNNTTKTSSTICLDHSIIC
ncbi:death-associated protein kinase related-like [Condylostylus longicornis]|uniref:death-associated protein kinase related-like n=1 Tax=Condylostylus longicornis TaxID=2530218 RepID=UPI00244DAA33|nr:death-associated protein kinase related-like [Condylostylus longicornis]